MFETPHLSLSHAVVNDSVDGTAICDNVRVHANLPDSWDQPARRERIGYFDGKVTVTSMPGHCSVGSVLMALPELPYVC